MSGLEVIGGISAVIAIIDASVKIRKNAEKDIGLPKTFETVARRLPVLLSTLQACYDQLDAVKETLPLDVVESFKGIVQNSKAHARLLRDIFEETIPGEDVKRRERYKAAVKSVGKGKRVEQLLQSISEDTRVLASYHSVQSAQPDIVPRLEELISELKAAEPSIPEEEPFKNFHNNNYGGQQNISTGDARHSGEGDQHIYGGVGAINQYPGSVHHHHPTPAPNRLIIHSKKCGLCLGGTSPIDIALFQGRSTELEEIRSHLNVFETSRHRRCVVLGGLGGIGKTQLAIAFAQRYQSFYDSIFWLNATSEAMLKVSFRQIAKVIFDHQNLRDFEDEQILDGVQQWLSEPSNSRWLIIFDNYDEPNVYDIKTYYPIASHGSIVVTTRLPSLVNGSHIRVEPLNKIEDRLAVLQTRSKRANVASDLYARRLAERLAGLPLALATAGAYLEWSPWSFERYLEEYEKRWNINPRMPTRLPDYKDQTLYTTWDLSYRQLQAQDPDAAQMLKLLAYFDNQRLWHGLFQGGKPDSSLGWLLRLASDAVEFENLMSVLAHYCFVEVQTATESYGMHNCVHDWTLASLNATVDARSYSYAFVCVATSINKDNIEVLGHVSYAGLAPHAARLTHSRFLETKLLIPIMDKYSEDAEWVAQLLQQQVLLAAAERMYSWTLVWKEKALGRDHTSTVRTVNNIGNLYFNQSKLEEAEQMYQRALAGYEKALGPDHTSTLSTVNNLGLLYRAQGKLEEAEQMYRRALAGKETALGPKHSSTLDTINNLSNLYYAQGKLEDAEQMYQRALARYEKALGHDHTSTLDTVGNLGILYSAQGKLEEAKQMYQRALARKETALGPDHTSTLSTINNLGNLYFNQGKLEEAEQMYQRALAGYEKVLRADHTSTLDTVNNLGNVYFNQGKLEETEQMYQRALAGYEKALGPDHTRTLFTVNNLGLLYRAQGKLEEAQQIYLRTLAGKEKALGQKH